MSIVLVLNQMTALPYSIRILVFISLRIQNLHFLLINLFKIVDCASKSFLKAIEKVICLRSLRSELQNSKLCSQLFSFPSCFMDILIIILKLFLLKIFIHKNRNKKLNGKVKPLIYERTGKKQYREYYEVSLNMEGYRQELSFATPTEMFVKHRICIYQRTIYGTSL